MTVAEIAQQLKLSPWQVEALEAGDYRRLPGSVFVRGFIRNYARLVKLDPASLLGATEAQPPSATPAAAPVAPPVNIPFPTERRVKWHGYAAAVVVIVTALAVYEFYPDDAPQNSATSAQVDAPAPPPVATERERANVEPVVSVPSTPAAPIVVATADPAPASKPSPVERSARNPDKSALAVADARHSANEQVVRMRFARESWVEIRDRNGRKIFSQLNAPGTEQVVTGVPPLSLIVGNAIGVQLTHNEQPVNLGPYTKVDVARLTLE
jgi:cytoskeleton protein RodZ